ncbi:hypothetical protein EYF80_041570 [Liparis tanakae]|uniref:Uncharacterized protein n=1 Tax=Liparis tanakae TaxID=230148 RepID=A0A4Z2G4N7_9TELE|nr:hypothetical protein EYF80_041570 [Liparis tanakae]
MAVVSSGSSDTMVPRLILSVYLVKKRGTYDGGEGQPADFISKEQGIPRSRFIVGIPENEVIHMTDYILMSCSTSAPTLTCSARCEIRLSLNSRLSAVMWRKPAILFTCENFVLIFSVKDWEDLLITSLFVAMTDSM